MALPGNLIAGRYQLDEPIGVGGYSEVWRATDVVLARPVAVKLLHPHYLQQPEALARFQAEARHAAALWHENIAHIYDYDETGDGLQPYLVMELVDGPSLAGELAGGPLDAARTMDIVAQTAAGLQAVHAVGLIHRDVKPGNLLLASSGTVKITDFGISHAIGSAPITITGAVMGSATYLAPERIAGAQAEPASDLYALGIVAYECLAGAPPFTGKPLDVACAHRDRSVPLLPVSVPAGTSALVMQLVAKDPAWRPGSAAEVAHRAGRLRDDLRRRYSAGAGRRRQPLAVPAAVPPPALAIAPAAFAYSAQSPVAAAPRPRVRTGALWLANPALVLASVAIAVLIGMAVAVTMGAASVQHPVGALPSAPPSHSASGTAAAPPARQRSSPAPSHKARPATRPGTNFGDTGTIQMFAHNHRSGRGRDHEKTRRHGHRYGDHGQGNGGGQGYGNGGGYGQGNGNGNGYGQGNVTAQVLSFSSRPLQGVPADGDLVAGPRSHPACAYQASSTVRPSRLASRAARPWSCALNVPSARANRTWWSVPPRGRPFSRTSLIRMPPDQLSSAE
jgi:serine/threonine-protein kinase